MSDQQPTGQCDEQTSGDKREEGAAKCTGFPTPPFDGSLLIYSMRNCPPPGKVVTQYYTKPSASAAGEAPKTGSKIVTVIRDLSNNTVVGDSRSTSFMNEAKPNTEDPFNNEWLDAWLNGELLDEVD